MTSSNLILHIARIFLETRENIKISTHPFYHINLGWFSWEWSKKKKNFFFEKKIQNGRLKKSSFFKIANPQNFFAKISQIGPWVSRIEWCKGHWCSSTYMAVRLSDKSLKTAKKYRKCIFWPFLSFCRTASRPYTFPMKISPNFYGRMDGSKFWCFPWFPENSLLCVILRYTVYVWIFSPIEI